MIDPPDTPPTPAPAAPPSHPRHIIGCMTGTSLDGLDAALVRIDGAGLTLTATLLAHVSLPLAENLAASLRALAQGAPTTPLEVLRAARRLGECHAQAVRQLQEQLKTSTPAAPVDLVAAHGQTLWHAPRDEAGALSWQLLDPWPIVRAAGVPVVYDLRQADLIAGGQGAPITPLADWVLLADASKRRAIANLGGICNITYLPPRPAAIATAYADLDAIGGEDVGPCNLLLDGLVQRLFPGLRYDKGGRLAARGGETSLLYRRIKEAPFFARPRPRSTGREDFSAAWIDDLVTEAGLPPHDLLASAVAAVAKLIAEAVVERTDELVLAGGGVKNKALEQRLRACLREMGDGHVRVRLSDELGVPAVVREAMEFAVLGALAQDGVPLTLPRITGADHPGRSGAWVYP